MKAAFVFLASFALLLSACGDKPAPGSAPSTAKSAEKKSSIENNSSGNPITAPVDYLGAVAKGKKFAEKTLDSTQLNKEIQLFQSQEGRFPKSLEELVTEKYLPAIPTPPYGMKYEYNPASGDLKVVKE